ncbi:TIGR02594 family protein [Hyphomicrobium methylovorum]|uniref:TIGR02594 family protein n=1 Tax=Hyphomicrobium methylovorum TaxID=84 RepID=UPI0015E77A1E|nr:TIGR02594 family protein [Hyphomicrobium methylovorum]MBA2124683.1 TIGR02594 family protein [Hyphomicrobium methylovorum]
MDQPPWLAAAWAEFGVREIPGSTDAPEIIRYFREAGDAVTRSETTPWCAAFAGAMLKRSGRSGTGSLLARSYLNWGTSLDSGRLGAVTVLSRGSNPGAGHVGFLIGESSSNLYLLGGNQNDAVSVAKFARSRLLGFRWPKDRETANAGNEIFVKALAHVLEMEGGYSNDPQDPGGPTNRGITLEVYAAFTGKRLDSSSRSKLISELKRIPASTVETIYRQRYFRKASCTEFAAPLALMHFDTAVNHGVGAAARMLQTALRVAVDGEIGPETIARARTHDLFALLDAYAEIRRGRYRALPHFSRFGRGWLKRVDTTLARAKDWSKVDPLNRGPLQPDQIAKGESTMANTKTNASELDEASKSWARSRTIWGTLITAAATVIPALGPAVGIVIPADVIQVFGDQAVTLAQALTALFGTILAIYGRLKADTPLALRKVKD